MRDSEERPSCPGPLPGLPLDSLSPSAQVSTHQDESTGASLQSTLAGGIAKEHAREENFGIAQDLKVDKARDIGDFP